MQRKLVWGSLLLAVVVSLAIVALNNESAYDSLRGSFFPQTPPEQNKADDQLSEKTKETIKQLTQHKEFPPRKVSTKEASGETLEIPENPEVFSQKDYDLRILSWLRRNVLKDYMSYPAKSDDEAAFLLEALDNFTHQPEAPGADALSEKALKFPIEKMNPAAMVWAGIVLHKAKKTEDAEKYLKESVKKLKERSYCSRYYGNLHTANVLLGKKGGGQWAYRKNVAEIVAKMVTANLFKKDEIQIAYRMVEDADHKDRWDRCFNILKDKQNSVDEWFYL